MNKTKQKVKKVGYALYVKFEEDKKFRRVGFTFHTKLEAMEYRGRNYSGANKYRIEGLRLNVEPVSIYSREGRE